MDDNNVGCPQCGARGLSLGGIVARETVSGEFSGSMSGVGLSSEGISVNGGSVHGGSTSTSHRALQFAPPSPMARRPSDDKFIIALIMFFMGLAMLILGDSIFDTLGLSSSDFKEEFYGITSYLPKIVGCVVSIAGLFHMISSTNNKPDPAVQAAYQKAVEVDNKVAEIHARLRYCEADHLVFDPVSKSSSHAEAADIHKMLRILAS